MQIFQTATVTLLHEIPLCVLPRCPGSWVPTPCPTLSRMKGQSPLEKSSHGEKISIGWSVGETAESVTWTYANTQRWVWSYFETLRGAGQPMLSHGGYLLILIWSITKLWEFNLTPSSSFYHFYWLGRTARLVWPSHSPVNGYFSHLFGLEPH